MRPLLLKRPNWVVLFLLLVIPEAFALAWDAASFKKPDDATLKSKLSPIEYQVTQKNETEPPFKNKYYSNKKSGIYVDVVSGEPLFSTLDQFDSGTGWPSFSRPLVDNHIITKADSAHGMSRTEIRSKYADSHLGHVFNDGPGPTGLRYCVNSASLRFVSAETLEQEGYGIFTSLFATAQSGAEQGKPVLKGVNEQQVAYFAGGCFWCMEPPFEGLKGVSEVISGYMGGREKNPTYDQVSKGLTGHAETVAVYFNPGLVTYEDLLKTYWVNIDPTRHDGQFCDKGRQYRPAIFYLGQEQKAHADKSLMHWKQSGRFEAIRVEISAAGEFTKAEDDHQDFYKKNPSRYRDYRSQCGRDDRLKTLWQNLKPRTTVP